MKLFLNHFSSLFIIFYSQPTTHNSKGLALIPLLLVAAIIAAVPVTITLVNEEQDNRQEAAGNYSGAIGSQCTSNDQCVSASCFHDSKDPPSLLHCFQCTDGGDHTCPSGECTNRVGYCTLPGGNPSATLTSCSSPGACPRSACDDDHECASDLCIEGVCRSQPSPLRGVCGEQADCRSGLTCSSGICIPPGNDYSSLNAACTNAYGGNTICNSTCNTYTQKIGVGACADVGGYCCQDPSSVNTPTPTTVPVTQCLGYCSTGSQVGCGNDTPAIDQNTNCAATGGLCCIRTLPTTRPETGAVNMNFSLTTTSVTAGEQLRGNVNLTNNTSVTQTYDFRLCILGTNTCGAPSTATVSSGSQATTPVSLNTTGLSAGSYTAFLSINETGRFSVQHTFQILSSGNPPPVGGATNPPIATQPPAPSGPTPPPNCGARGDVNSDGVVSSGDKDLAEQFAVGKITLTDSQQKRADVNNDGSVGIGDVVEIERYILGKETSFSGCPGNSNNTNLDVSVVDYSLDKSSYSAGGTIVVTFSVRNNSTTPIKSGTPITASVFRNAIASNLTSGSCASYPQNCATVTETKTLPSFLDPGKSLAFRITLSEPPTKSAPANAGSFNFSIYADPSNQLNDPSRGNNIVSIPYSVTGSTTTNPTSTPRPTTATQSCASASGRPTGCSCTDSTSNATCISGNCAAEACGGINRLCCPAGQVYCAKTGGCTSPSNCNCAPDAPTATPNPGGTCIAAQNQTRGSCNSGYVCINTSTGPRCVTGSAGACIKLGASCDTGSNNFCCSGMSCQSGKCQKIATPTPGGTGSSGCSYCVTNADCGKPNTCGQADGNTCIMNNGVKFCVKY